MATPKKSSGSSNKTSKKSSSGSTKNGKVIGSTRTAPKKTAEYKSKYANKNVTGSKKSGEKIVAPSLANPKETQIKMVQNAIAKFGDPDGSRARALARLQGTTTQSTQQTTTDQATQTAMDYINSQDLSSATKQLYSDILTNWDPNTELNPQNIIKAFENIKKTTIDPHYQGLANLAIASIQTAAKGMEEQRALELESEQANAAQGIRDTQAGLEASGLTFTGEGVRQLGTDLAASIPFGGASVEGLIPQRSRLISTSSEAAYKQNLKNLGLSAEEQLGTSKTKKILGKYGYNTVGGVAGSLNESKQSSYGSALSNLLGQQTANVQQGYNLDVQQGYNLDV